MAGIYAVQSISIDGRNSAEIKYSILLQYDAKDMVKIYV